MLKSTHKIMIYCLLVCGILYFVEQGVGVVYSVKAGLKIILFALIPFFILKQYELLSFSGFFHIGPQSHQSTKRALILSGLVFVTLMGLGLLLAPMIDFVSLRQELSTKLNVTKGVFLAVALYITFINSLLEEFFFRGFINLSVAKEHKKIGALFSAVIFGVYHMAMFQTWFPPIIVLLCVVGLVGVGLFFNWINERSKSFMNSWLIHIVADSAIMILGYMKLYL